MITREDLFVPVQFFVTFMFSIIATGIIMIVPHMIFGKPGLIMSGIIGLILCITYVLQIRTSKREGTK